MVTPVGLSGWSVPKAGRESLDWRVRVVPGLLRGGDEAHYPRGATGRERRTKVMGPRPLRAARLGEPAPRERAGSKPRQQLERRGIRAGAG